jgi:hypothetical protein
MAGWSEVGLVLAGSVGPLLVTVVTQRGARRDRDEDRRRGDLQATLALHAELVAACTQVDADWCDYAVFPPRDVDEERELDAARDAHYASLNLLAARVRLTAPPGVRAATEVLLAEVRHAQQLARGAQRGEPDERAWVEHGRTFAAARDAFLDAAKAAVGRPVAG